ncbi:MAG: four helix bundle protein [Chlamydiae bacterium]|nr:four helix bundle protein [Chlamydiota bacterium]
MEQQFEKLEVWKQGMELTKKIYQITLEFPREEQYGLTSQLRRASVSVPVNIAEGKGRFHKKEFIQFLFIARGSLYELMTLIRVAEELTYLKRERVEELRTMMGQITGMINALIETIR